MELPHPIISMLWEHDVRLEKKRFINDNVIVSETVLRYLMLMQEKHITKFHKVTCVYEACIYSNNSHLSLLIRVKMINKLIS